MNNSKNINTIAIQSFFDKTITGVDDYVNSWIKQMNRDGSKIKIININGYMDKYGNHIRCVTYITKIYK